MTEQYKPLHVPGETIKPSDEEIGKALDKVWDTMVAEKMDQLACDGSYEWLKKQTLDKYEKAHQPPLHKKTLTCDEVYAALRKVLDLPESCISLTIHLEVGQVPSILIVSDVKLHGAPEAVEYEPYKLIEKKQGE